MKITLLLTSRDIITSKVGLHYQVETDGDIILNFTPDAMEELVNDYKAIKEQETEEKKDE